MKRPLLNDDILQAQEDAFNNKTAELTAKSEDQSIGLVTRNKVHSQYLETIFAG